MIVNAGYRGKVGAKAPKFTYTGQYNIRKDGVVELLTSGTIVFLEPKVIDVFMVGGGGAGATNAYGDFIGGGGGGGGYTRTVRKLAVNADANYVVTVGAGQVPKSSGSGGASAFGNHEVPGGLGGGNARNDYICAGYAGGSGGGGFANSYSDGGVGGSDGGAGEAASYAGGAGQGFTTREFGEPTGKLYAGGGGGGRYISAQSTVVSMGGAGGGGAGAWWGGTDAKFQEALAGVANTGGGGGGGINKNGVIGSDGGSGGSGIVCFRESVELPELAGTWVLNNRIYAPENNLNEAITFTVATGTQFSRIVTDANYLRYYTSISTMQTIYNFATNVWQENHDRYGTITFPAGAAASDEFRRWLASNATKQ